jgi:hypothetical protein
MPGPSSTDSNFFVRNTGSPTVRPAARPVVRSKKRAVWRVARKLTGLFVCLNCSCVALETNDFAHQTGVADSHLSSPPCVVTFRIEAHREQTNADRFDATTNNKLSTTAFHRPASSNNNIPTEHAAALRSRHARTRRRVCVPNRTNNAATATTTPIASLRTSSYIAAPVIDSAMTTGPETE